MKNKLILIDLVYNLVENKTKLTDKVLYMEYNIINLSYISFLLISGEASRRLHRLLKHNLQ